MSKELETLEKIKLGYICGQGAINEFALKENERENFKIIETALKEHEVMKQTKIVVSDPKVSDEDLEKLINQRMLTILQGEIKPLFDEEVQKILKSLEIIKKKKVDVGYLFEMITLFDREGLKQYNLSCYGIKKTLTKEECCLLKEVLK